MLSSAFTRALSVLVAHSLVPAAQAALAGASGVPATNYRGVFGACGTKPLNTDLGVSLNMALFDSGDYCGRTVQITTTGGKSAQGTVVDRCGPGGTCSNEGGIDLTNKLFAAIGGDIDTSADLSLDTTFGYGHVLVDFKIGDGQGDSATTASAAEEEEEEEEEEEVTSVSASATTSVVSASTEPNGRTCSKDNAIVCNGNGTWSKCSNGEAQNQGQVPPGTVCQDGSMVAAARLARHRFLKRRI